MITATRGKAAAARAGGPGRSCGSGGGRASSCFPSLLTTGNLFCGFFSLLLAVDQRYIEAALVDLRGDDHGPARRPGGAAHEGHQPVRRGVRLAGRRGLVLRGARRSSSTRSRCTPLGRAAWFGAFLFVICGALRLARFNVQTGSVDRRFFVGLSTPAAAGVVAPS